MILVEERRFSAASDARLLGALAPARLDRPQKNSRFWAAQRF